MPPRRNFGRRRGDGGADVDEVQPGVDAGGRPRTDVHAVLVGYVAPRLVAGLAGGGHEAPPPQLLAGLGVVGRDDARLGPRPRAAAPARERLAAGDDGAGRVPGGVHGVVEDLGLPDQLAGAGVDGVDVVVVARVDDAGAVDGDVAVHADQAPDVVVDVVGEVAAVLPAQVAGHRVDGLDDVVRVRHVEDAAVGDGRALLAAGGEGARPHHAQVADVVAVDLVEGAVPPAVEGAAPHEPVAVGRVREHGVGDGHEVVAGLRGGVRDEDRRDDGRRRQPTGSGAQWVHGSDSRP